MAWNDPPYVVNDASHSARLFRRQAQKESGEGSGVDRPGDLKVMPLTVPGTGFRVAAGGAVIQSRDLPSTSRESYGPVNDAEITVSGVVGTGSSGGRRDLVVVEIMDPKMESKSYDPVAAAAVNYTRIVVIQGVPSTAKSLEDVTDPAWANVTGYALAAINWPASTGTITAGMIEDLRRVQSPKSSFETRSLAMTGLETDVLNAGTAYPAGGQTWPTAAETGWGPIQIPSWATEMEIRMDWASINFPGGEAAGDLWVQVAATANPANVKTKKYSFNAPAVGNETRLTTFVAERLPVPAALRGTSQVFYPRATLAGSFPAAARPRLGYGSGMAFRVDFFQSTT